MDRIKYLKYYILIFILGSIFSLFIWEKYLSSDEVITVHDSTVVKVPIDVPVPYEVIKWKYSHTAQLDTLILHDTIYLYDTIRIVQDFKYKRIYKDTIRDEDLVAYLDETIQYNRITDREFSYQILRPIEIVENDFRSISIGSMISINSVIPNVTYYNNNWGYSLGYDPFNKLLHIGLDYKIVSF